MNRVHGWLFGGLAVAWLGGTASAQEYVNPYGPYQTPVAPIKVTLGSAAAAPVPPPAPLPAQFTAGYQVQSQATPFAPGHAVPPQAAPYPPPPIVQAQSSPVIQAHMAQPQAVPYTPAALTHLQAKPMVTPVTTGQTACQTNCCDDCGNNGCGHWLADLELTFLRFHDADGFNTDNIFNFEFGPRLTVGYVGANGLGGRIRWWSYDHDANDAGNPVSVDTYNLDFELFHKIELSCRAAIEVSGGIRYNEMDYTKGQAIEDFSGYGGLFGLKATWATSECSHLYVRACWAFLMDNGEDGAGTDFDVVRDQSEIGLGYEQAWFLDCGAVLTGRIGAEFQNWGGYQDAADGNIGFGGFLLGLGLLF